MCDSPPFANPQVSSWRLANFVRSNIDHQMVCAAVLRIVNMSVRERKREKVTEERERIKLCVCCVLLRFSRVRIFFILGHINKLEKYPNIFSNIVLLFPRIEGHFSTRLLYTSTSY